VVTRRPRILLVDDFPDNREMYALYLEYAGFEVAEAATGYEALAQAFAQIPDLIVMDLSLPGLDGWEATRRFKSDPRTSQIPVLALTGHALDGYSQGARDAGCDAFVTKPCLPEELAAEIRTLLGAGTSSSESGRGGHHETQA
jgi:two-component system, cell cycle response regulator DivK